MRTDQCGRCIRYLGGLQCDTFPNRIPEKILTGEWDHTNPLSDLNELLFEPVSEKGSFAKAMVKANDQVLADHVEDLVDREGVGYRRAMSILKRKGYTDADFEIGGVLYGHSTNELLSMLKKD